MAIHAQRVRALSRHGPDPPSQRGGVFQVSGLPNHFTERENGTNRLPELRPTLEREKRDLQLQGTDKGLVPRILQLIVNNLCKNRIWLGTHQCDPINNKGGRGADSQLDGEVVVGLHRISITLFVKAGCEFVDIQPQLPCVIQVTLPPQTKPPTK